MIPTSSSPEIPSRLRAGLSSLGDLGFSPEVIHQLNAEAECLRCDREAMAAMAAFRQTWPDAAADSSIFSHSLTGALAVVDCIPEYLSRHAARDIPKEISAATLKDLERRILEYREKSGEWGFDRVDWMRNHLTQGLVQLGRLQFIPGTWREDFSIYTYDRQIKAVAEAGLNCDQDGYPVKDPEGAAFQTTLKNYDHSVSGHVVDPRDATVHRTPECLPTANQACIKEGDPVLHIHIPTGPGFTEEACRAAIEQAQGFFKRFMPETEFKAICCRSWLMDPALAHVLPHDSNILRFARLFHLLPVPGGTDQQHVERIFGAGTDWAKAIPRTRLQKATQQYLAEGGKLRLTAGFILW